MNGDGTRCYEAIPSCFFFFFSQWLYTCLLPNYREEMESPDGVSNLDFIMASKPEVAPQHTESQL